MHLEAGIDGHPETRYINKLSPKPFVFHETLSKADSRAIGQSFAGSNHWWVAYGENNQRPEEMVLGVRRPCRLREPSRVPAFGVPV